MSIYDDTSAYWTSMCGIYRHDDYFKSNGRYYVVMLPATFEAVRFFSDGLPGQQYAVCDDFGNLVRVQ